MEFAERLVAALARLGFDAYLDKKDIAPGEPWRERLTGLIEAADAVVFLLSPDSVASDICAWEVDEAERMAKRVLPAVARRVEATEVPGRLRRFNWIDFAQGGGFEAALGELQEALTTDIAWVREHTRLVGLAEHWARGGRPADGVMSPADIGAAERLLEGRPRNADPPPQVLADFLAASRAHLEEEMRRLRRTTGRAFVKPALEALRNGAGEHAIRLAAAGVLLAKDLGFHPDLRTGLREPAARAIFESRTRVVLKGHDASVLVAAFSADGQRIVTTSDGNTARIWDAATGKAIACLEGHPAGVRSAAFSADGQRIVTASYGTAHVWDVVTGKAIASLGGHTASVQSAGFSPNGQQIVTASADNTARLWDAATGKQIAPLDQIEAVQSAAFSPDGQRIVTTTFYDPTTTQGSNTARIWDVSRSASVVRSLPIALTAALAHGIGHRTDAERADLLMQDAPDDLYAEALRQLGRSADDPEIAEIAARLRAPLHPNCYLSPTQFAEKFGLPLPSRATREETAPADAAAPRDPQPPARDTDATPSETKPPAPTKQATLSPRRRWTLGGLLGR